MTQPHLAGIGGGSSIVLHSAVHGRDYAIGRARARTRNAEGCRRDARTGGTKSLADTLQPAIDAAANGFTVGRFLSQDVLDARVPRFQPETKAIFLPAGR